ncbi:hypothetical protein CHLRE_16g680400v5 [Chlamydomonas reinhardtii]|uniref:Uncharacterized protein n=1 Tax=Chlamydomonas reinhardtii TaxID=3055 RepID=A0A2K3CV37_CHLRE|nr:uncharacterized protein CHLRE_16g680400v5 [Chlamydomonas reinhardtii]PNW72150.1 hypothetical protein CHLRE_16g680400v5 [Chlamydomonas reinhardtii]
MAPTAAPARRSTSTSGSAAGSRCCNRAVGCSLRRWASWRSVTAPTGCRWRRRRRPPEALEAARQVLSRLPPELHSVLLNAAELFTGLELCQAGMGLPQQQQAQAQQAGNSSGGAAPDGGLPHHLQSLPQWWPSTSWAHCSASTMATPAPAAVLASRPAATRCPGRALDHLLSGSAAAYAPGVAGAGADGGPQPRGSTSGMATVMMPSATTGLDSSSHAALQLFNQVLPALTQSVATVRRRLGGGFGAPVPCTVNFELVQRSPVGPGAMLGSQLKASRKERPPGGAEYYEGGSSGVGGAGGGSGLCSQASSQLGQGSGVQQQAAVLPARGAAAAGRWVAVGAAAEVGAAWRRSRAALLS